MPAASAALLSWPRSLLTLRHRGRLPCGGGFPAGFAVAAKGTAKQTYVCSDCGVDYPRWSGKCPSCGAWNVMQLFTPAASPAPHHSSPSHFKPGQASFGPSSPPRSRSWVVADGGTSAGQAGAGADGLVALSSISSRGHERQSFGSPELDRAFGGGLVAGSVVLLGGPPGSGKSTLLLQIAALLGGGTTAAGAPYVQQFTGVAEGARFFNSSTGEGTPLEPPPPLRGVAYFSGEESVNQLKGRAERLGIHTPGLLVMNETCLETILHQLQQPSLPPLAAIIIDSVQTMFTESLPGSAGSVFQVKEVAVRLTQFAKATGTPVFLIGHVTKEGSLAGPRVLEHLVDVVLYVDGDNGSGSGGGESEGRSGGGQGHYASRGAPVSSTTEMVGSVPHVPAASSSDGGTVSGSPLPPHHSNSSGGGGGVVCMVRALKNRYGATETAIFAMGDRGFSECDPARLFLSRYQRVQHSGGGGGSTNAAAPAGSSEQDEMEWTSAAGSAAAVTLEGTRPLCVEIQALSNRPVGAYPRQRTIGVSLDRVSMLLAVLGRHTPLKRMHSPLSHDLIVSAVGGLRVTDPAADLAIAVAVASSILGVPVPLNVLLIGEVGLGGEIRATGHHLRQRVSTAQRLGFTRVYVPAGTARELAGLWGQGASTVTHPGSSAGPPGGDDGSGSPQHPAHPHASFRIEPVRSLGQLLETLFAGHWGSRAVRSQRTRSGRADWGSASHAAPAVPAWAARAVAQEYD